MTGTLATVEAADTVAISGTYNYLGQQPEIIYVGFENRGARALFEDRNMIVPPTEDI